MNCHEFEEFVVDLARDSVTDSSVGTRSWAHAANCPRCAEKLLHQEKLTAGLDALAARTETMRQTDQFEVMLRSEFRAQFTQAKAPMVRRPAPVTSAASSGMNRSFWAWAAAAAVLLLALGGLLATRVGSLSPVIDTAHNGNVPKGKPVIGPVNPSQTPPFAVSGQEEPAVAAMNKSAAKKHNKSAVKPTFRSSDNVEVATNFYPLPYGSGLPLDEGWEIVRVSIPRSSLATLGVPLPAGEQTSTTPIKADLVLGVDGMARAIRFVE